MKKRSVKKINNQGFTIVEFIITISILGIASIGIASLFYTSQYTQKQSRYIDAATRAAQREVETLRNSSYNNLQDGQTINFTTDLPDSLPKSKSGVAVISEPSDGLKRVDVTVSFTESGRTQNVKLSSLIGLIGISQ